MQNMEEFGDAACRGGKHHSQDRRAKPQRRTKVGGGRKSENRRTAEQSGAFNSTFRPGCHLYQSDKNYGRGFQLQFAPARKIKGHHHGFARVFEWFEGLLIPFSELESRITNLADRRCSNARPKMDGLRSEWPVERCSKGAASKRKSSLLMQ